MAEEEAKSPQTRYWDTGEVSTDGKGTQKRRLARERKERLAARKLQRQKLAKKKLWKKHKQVYKWRRRKERFLVKWRDACFMKCQWLTRGQLDQVPGAHSQMKRFMRSIEIHSFNAPGFLPGNGLHKPD